MSINASDILAVTRSVTKEWTKQRKAEERGSRRSRAYMYSDRVNFTDVAAGILPPAYQHASGGGLYSVSQRQFFYAAREAFKQKTGREIDAKYFATRILRPYLNRHPQETATWKITADPRGTLTLPNCGHDVRIPVGTLQIDEHLRKAGNEIEALTDLDAEVRTEWPSLAGGHRYQAVLYIEKEGFEPLLEEAEIAKRFDLAIISCKGQSVVAARRFVDMTCYVGSGVPLFVVHDFDKYGFEISQRLTTVSESQEEQDCVAYYFENEINVIDLGLRLADVEKYGLASESHRFKGTFASDSIATDEERKFLRSHHRVELNAFTSPQFIEWLEGNLTKHGLKKRLIPADDVLEQAYRRALAAATLNKAIEDVLDSAIADAEDAKVPKTLRRLLKAAMKDQPGAWDAVLYEMAKTKVYADSKE